MNVLIKYDYKRKENIPDILALSETSKFKNVKSFTCI